MGTLQDQVAEIFQRTDDGLLLQGSDIRLLESAKTGVPTCEDRCAVDALHGEVVSGAYVQKLRWLHGIEHLTRRPDGHVFWKDACVEHFTFADAVRSLAAAQRLAQKCLLLESKGFPVNGRTVLCRAALTAPANTPWLLALLRYYAFFENKDGTVAGVFYTHADKSEPLEALSVWKVDGSVKTEKLTSGYMAYRVAESRGAKSLDLTDCTYADFEAVMKRTAITAQELAALL
jgi:hypothetical protein